MARIEPSQHVFIAGGTGSGKTVLARHYLAGNEKQVFVLDTKGTFKWPEVPDELQITIVRLSQIEDAARNFKFVIYRPIFEELNDEFYDAFFSFCYRLGKCTVYVDEAAQVCKSAQQFPVNYFGILTRGRELDVNVWSSTQRPANIPITIYSEASHWFIFRLKAEQDRKKLFNYSGQEEFLTAAAQYWFYYADMDGGGEPVYATLKLK